jgi:hypothetical protein
MEFSAFPSFLISNGVRWGLQFQPLVFYFAASGIEIRTHLSSLTAFHGFSFFRCQRRLPFNRSLGEAKVKILEIGPLHNNLKKGWSEPRWVRKISDELE